MRKYATMPILAPRIIMRMIINGILFSLGKINEKMGLCQTAGDYKEAR
jgi:hypothetical protein